MKKILFTRASNNYYFDLGLSVNNDRRKNERYMLDTGSSSTHVPYQQYIRSDNYKYSEYPFSKDNELIENPEKQRVDLLLLNDYILHYSETNVFVGNKVSQKRMQIFYGGNIFVLLEDKIKLPFLSGICKFFEIESDPEKIEASSIFNMAVRAISPSNTRASSPSILSKSKNIIDRGEDPERLIGMDNISQVNLSTTVFNQNINILSVSLPENDNLPIDQYKVLLFLSGIKIYIRTPVIHAPNNQLLPPNYNDSLFYFGKENLFFDRSFQEFYQSAITNKTLNLILINENHYRFKNYIANNANIDGWIFSTKTGYEMWIKDINSLSNFENVDDDPTNIDKEKYSFEEDMHVLTNFNVVSWVISI